MLSCFDTMQKNALNSIHVCITVTKAAYIDTYSQCYTTSISNNYPWMHRGVPGFQMSTYLELRIWWEWFPMLHEDKLPDLDWFQTHGSFQMAYKLDSKPLSEFAGSHKWEATVASSRLIYLCLRFGLSYQNGSKFVLWVECGNRKPDYDAKSKSWTWSYILILFVFVCSILEWW